MRPTVTGADERIHAVEDPSPQWTDAHTFTVWDPASGLFLLLRMAVLPNVPAATAGVLAWLGAKPEYSYGHGVDEAPLADWDDLAVAGLRIRELEPLVGWQVDLDDGDNAMTLQWRALSGAVAYTPPKTFAAGHYEQSCRVAGRIALNGRRVEVDGVGQREHTWGARDTTALAGWHAITGFLGAGDRLDARTFDILEVGPGTADGYVHDGGEDRRITTLHQMTELEPDSGARSTTLAVAVDGGRTFTITGAGQGTGMAMPAGPEGGLVHLRLMRFSTDDGLEGYGLYERMAP